ncbi:hypothetical protein [Streptomyces fragilis]|uniref:Secreted protein n=1 Tax=Streptomyces fragilis TaxID=67301 RepID=A0ABV2YMD3_9ACTN|nr:hypothetical protein [Streptomyces fragilis]
MTEARTEEARTPEAGETVEGAGAPDAFAAVPAEQAARKPGRGRRIAVVSAVALVTAAAVAVSGFTWVTVRDADRDPGKPVWKYAEAPDPQPSPVETDGLRGALLSWEDDLSQGPDMGEYGSDVELNGKQAAALAKESFDELPRSQRRQLEREIDKRRMKGVAMRSYTVQGRRGAYVTEVVLTQMSNEKDARSGSIGRRQIFESVKDLGIAVAGPKVPGHGKNARCYVIEADKKGRNEFVHCVGHQGEVTVSLSAFAPRPIEKKDIAGLMGKQLDRIETPGEAV